MLENSLEVGKIGHLTPKHFFLSFGKGLVLKIS